MATSAARPQLPLCSTALLPAELLQRSTAGLALPWLPQDKPFPRESCSFCTVSLVHPKSDGHQVSEPFFTAWWFSSQLTVSAGKSVGKESIF